MSKVRSVFALKKSHIAVAAVIGGGFVTGAAIAQEAEEEALALEKILVTAQKRVQSLQDVPLSVSALSEEELLNAGVSDVQDMKALVPALNIYSAAQPAMTSVTLRGAGTGAADPTLQPSVGVFIDGVFMPRSVFGMQDLVDVERVEVLLGPQGTLYGKNTNAGVISVLTKGAPSDFELQAEATLGDYGRTDVKVTVANPLTDDVSFRLGVVSRQSDGYLENSVTGNSLGGDDNLAIRGQLYWDITESLSARIVAYTSEDKGGTNVTEHNFDSASLYRSTLIPAYAAMMGLRVEDVVNDDPTDHIVAITEHPTGQTLDPTLSVDGGSLQLEYDLGDMTLTSITAWQSWEQDDFFSDTDGTALDISYTIDNMEETSFSQELRLSSFGDGSFDWIAGLFYFDSELERGSENEPYSGYTLGLPGVPAPAALQPFAASLVGTGDTTLWYNNHGTESIAVFGQGTWQLSDATSMVVGLRYGREDKSLRMMTASFDLNGTEFNALNVLTGQYQGGIFGALASGNVAEVTPVALAALGGAPLDSLNLAAGPVHREGEKTDTDFTGMVSLNHKVDDVMYYATIATGAKSGGFNGSFGAESIDGREFEQEKTTNFEVGAKMDLMDGRMRLNAALFNTVYKDFQAATFDPATIAFKVINAGEQTTRGLDVDLKFLMTENLTFTAKAEYLDATYNDFKGANCNRLAEGVEFVVPGGSVCNLDGQTLAYAPKWQGSLSLDYVKEWGEGEIYANLNNHFKTEHLSDPTRAPYSETDYSMLNAKVGWRNDSWNVSVWANNLTDVYFARAHTGNVMSSLVGLPTEYRRWVNDPRTVGVTVRYTFY